MHVCVTATVTNVLFYFLHSIACSEHAILNHRSLILLCDITRTSIVMSYSSIVLHVQIGANAIFTSEWQPWQSISHHPVFTA